MKKIIFLGFIIIIIFICKIPETRATTPDPCLYDYSGITWIGPRSTTTQFICNSVQGSCEVHFSFFFRVIRNQNGNIIHRDVQVTEYWYDNDCDCPHEVINAMLRSIWGNQEVRDSFNIDDEIECYGTKCWYDHRVITSDCWEQDNDEMISGHYYSKKCDDAACCHATYQVCYQKAGCGSVSVTSYSKLYNGDFVDVDCESPCEPIGCDIWRPSGNSGAKRGVYENNSIPCNEKIQYLINQDKIEVTFESKSNGKVLFKLYDLLGNTLIQDENYKNKSIISISYDNIYKSGIYFYCIYLNNEIILNKSIMILK